MYKSCIEYKGKAYPIVDMEASVEGWGNVVIGTMSLEYALFPGYENGRTEPADEEAEEIDNAIYFYVDDDEIDREDLAEIVMQSTGDEFELMHKYTESVMRNVRQTLDLEPGDTSCDEEINKMDEMEVFERWLQWEGIFGYTQKIKDAVDNIFYGK